MPWFSGTTNLRRSNHVNNKKIVLHFTNAFYGPNIKSNKQETVEMEELKVGEIKHLIYVKNVENCWFQSSKHYPTKKRHKSLSTKYKFTLAYMTLAKYGILKINT